VEEGDGGKNERQEFRLVVHEVGSSYRILMTAGRMVFNEDNEDESYSFDDNRSMSHICFQKYVGVRVKSGEMCDRLDR